MRRRRRIRSPRSGVRFSRLSVMQLGKSLAYGQRVSAVYITVALSAKNACTRMPISSSTTLAGSEVDGDC